MPNPKSKVRHRNPTSEQKIWAAAGPSCRRIDGSGLRDTTVVRPMAGIRGSTGAVPYR